MRSNLEDTAIAVLPVLLQYFIRKKKFPTDLKISLICLTLDTTLELSWKQLAPQSLQLCVFSLAFLLVPFYPFNKVNK